jgi:hypothetical protein
MNVQNLLLGAMLAIGCGIGFNVNANTSALSECCRVLQEECQLNYGQAGCAQVYNRCMASRHCVLN